MALIDCRRRVANMQHEGTSAYGRTIDPGGNDAEVVGEGSGVFTGGGDSVDIPGFQTGVRQGVQGGVGVQCDHRHVGDLAHPRGLRRPDDGDASGLHDLTTGLKRGSVMSPKRSNATSSGMSSFNASGVCGQSTMLVIIRGPSSRATTAME